MTLSLWNVYIGFADKFHMLQGKYTKQVTNILQCLADVVQIRFSYDILHVVATFVIYVYHVNLLTYTTCDVIWHQHAPHLIFELQHAMLIFVNH